MLRAGYVALALKLQEAADLSANDICSRLRDAINDANRGTGKWAYYIDHFGDAESGDVVYSCDGDTMKAPYSITDTGGASKCIIDMESAVDVVPRTIYEQEADEPDHYAAMEESLKTEKLYDSLPLYERFISKAERDKADSSDFAGKGKSFPILKPEDVSAAAHALGRAGSGNLGPSGIKARIIAIAKRKGWTKYLPKAWQTTDAAESDSRPTQRLKNGTQSSGNQRTSGDYVVPSSDTQLADLSNSVFSERRESSQNLVNRETSITLLESATALETIVIREAKADYEIKLIAPGKGSSAFYPAEVLKRDGPKVFTEGTHVYLNHPTATEEAQRPEGDVANLAGVLTTKAEYHESHAKGPGLYARMKVFADHAQQVEEKAAHVGMSIRAAGIAESGKTRDGVPVLKELTHAESVDVVTRAGAGGMILTEAARTANPTQEDAMDAAELKKLQESITATNAANAKLLERALRGDARELARELLADITLPEKAKTKVIEAVIRELPKTEAGELDTKKFGELVMAEAKREGEYLGELMGSGRVVGLGTSGETPVVDPAKLREAKAAQKQELADLQEAEADIFTSLTGGNKRVGMHIAGKVA